MPRLARSHTPVLPSYRIHRACLLLLSALLFMGAPARAQDDYSWAGSWLWPSDIWSHGLNNQTYPPKDDMVGGDPVILFTGDFHLEETDLHIQSRGSDLAFERAYRSGTIVNSPLGRNWDFVWNKRIVLEIREFEPTRPGPHPVAFGGSTPGPTKIVKGAFFYDGATRLDKFSVNPALDHTWSSPVGYFAKLRHTGEADVRVEPPVSFVMRSANGSILTFGKRDLGRSPFERGSVYRVTQIEDRQGNITRFEYQEVIVPGVYRFWRIKHVFDTLGRRITLDYDEHGHLSTITDFEDRTVAFTHDLWGRLTEARSPLIDGTITENDFPLGRVTKYGYGTTVADWYWLRTVTAPTEASANIPYVTNTYDTFGRVVKQVFGGIDSNGFKAGGTFAFIYRTFSAPGVPTSGYYFGSFNTMAETLQVDPNGNVRHVKFDRFGNDVQTLDYTDRFNPLDVSSSTTIEHVVESLDEPLQSSDPDAFVTQKQYSNQGLVERVRTPGADIINTYDTSPDAFLKGNLLKQERFPVSGGDDPIVTIYAYEPIFNQVRAAIDPRGIDANYEPQNGGDNSPNRYMSQVVFDYQEQPITSGPIHDLINTWSIDTTQQFQSDLLVANSVSLAGIVSSCTDGDKNGDGNQDQRRGNPIVISPPSPEVFVDPVNSDTNFDALPMPTVIQYNEFSLPIATIEPLLVTTTFEYHPESDPDGDGIPTESPPVTLDDQDGPNGGGFLRDTHLPEGVDEAFEYDKLGRTTRVVNGRGAATKIDYNAVGEVVQIEDAKGYRTQNIYDANGRVTSTRRTNKVPTYDGLARPDGGEVSGATGDWIEDHFKYDLLDHLIEEDIQADGTAVRLKTRHRYDRRGNRVLTLLPESNADALNVTSVIYDERNLPWKSTRGGLASEFRQLFANADIAEANESMESATASTVETAYNVAGLPATVIDGEFNTATYEYDGFQRLLVATDPSGNTVTTSYHPPNLVVEVVATDLQAGPPGVELSRTKYKYDELGRCFQIDRLLDALGSDVPTPDGPLSAGDELVTERIQFDAKGRVVRVVDDNKVSVENVYDALDRVKQSVRKSSSGLALGNATKYGYDLASNLIRTESVESDSAGQNPVSFVTRSFYDALNRPVAVSDNLGHTIRRRYDSRGNLVFESDAKAEPSSLTLTSLESANEHSGLPTFAINDHGNTTRYDYDDAGRPIRTTRHMRELGMGGNALLTGGAGSIVTQQTYDKNSRLRTQSDDTGNTTTYSYDALNRLRRTDFADGTSEEVQEFDRNDNVKTRTDANGSSITNGYDANRRRISRAITPASSVLGTTSESYAYDGLGRMVSGSDNDSLITRKYDTLGRVVEETVLDASMTPRTTTTVYDGVGLLSSLLYPSGRRVQNHFDGFNRLEAVENAASMTTVASYKYVGPGRLESRDYPIPGTRLVVSYDGVRRVQGMDHTKVASGIHIDQRTFGWDRAFNKTSRLNGSSSVLHSYTYDSAYQLVTSARSGGTPPVPRDLSYSLDGVGNRAQLGIDAVLHPYLMDDGHPDPADEQMNQYTSTHVDDREYDAAGNLVETVASSSTLAAIRYDYRNQMVEYADFVSGETHKYHYDVLGRRIRKIVDANGTPDVTQYFYQGWRTIEERDGAGTVTATYVYGNGLDEVLNMRRGGNDYFYHQDDLGNVMAVTDASGTAVERYDYGDYGAPLDGVSHSPIAGSSIGNPLFFTGARFDEETGLYYMRMRYLDPRVGRFTTRDPIGMWGDASSRGNGSTYAGSNPWTFTDPMGLAKGLINGTSIFQQHPPLEFPPWWDPDITRIYGVINAHSPRRQDGVLCAYPGTISADVALIIVESVQSDADPYTCYGQFGGDREYGCGGPSGRRTSIWEHLIEWLSDENDQINIPINSDITIKVTADFAEDVAALLLPPASNDPVGAGVYFAGLLFGGVIADDVGRTLGAAWNAIKQGFTKNADQIVETAAKGASQLVDEVGKASRAPDFVVAGDGQVFPVPQGATGGTSTRAPGVQFAGGSGGHGLDPKVTGVRFMGATGRHGERAVYMNATGQTVNPWTGRTVASKSPFAHFSFTGKTQVGQ